MAGKIYKTASGTQLNIDHLRLLNEGVVAVGNMHVNARGDEVNADGSVKQTRTDIMRNNYRLNAPLVKTQKNSTPEQSRPANSTRKVTREAAKPNAPVTPKPELEQPVASDSLRGSLANAIINAAYRPGEEIVEEESVTDTESQPNSDLFSTSDPIQRTITRI